MIPKGKLLIIGGAEDKGHWQEKHPPMKIKNKDFRHYEILGELLPPDKRKHQSIEVVTTASSIPEEVGRTYVRAYEKAGFKNVHQLNIDCKDEARNPEFLERISKAHAVLFSGGDQLRLST